MNAKKYLENEGIGKGSNITTSLCASLMESYASKSTTIQITNEEINKRFPINSLRGRYDHPNLIVEAERRGAKWMRDRPSDQPKEKDRYIRDEDGNIKKSGGEAGSSDNYKMA